MTGRGQDELGEMLRKAVEVIRSEPMPEEALGRALRRARGIGEPGPHFPWRAGLLVLAAAASLVLSLALRPGQRQAGPAEAEEPLPDGPPPRVFAGPSRVLGLPVPDDDFLRIGLERPEGRDLRRSALRVEARLADGQSRTTVEHLFDSHLPFDAVARFEDALPEGAALVSRKAQVGGDEFDAADCFPLPAGARARVTVIYDQPLTLRAGRLVYSFPLPHGLLDELSFTLTADEELSRGATFLPANAQRGDADGQATWTVEHRRVRPSGSILFVSGPRR